MAHNLNIRELAGDAFAAAWGTTLPIQNPNKKFDPPETGAWARYTITIGENVNAAIGGLLERSAVVFGCQISIPLLNGDKLPYQIADDLKPLLENKNLLSSDSKTTLKTRRLSILDAGEVNGRLIFAVTIAAIADTE